MIRWFRHSIRIALIVAFLTTFVVTSFAGRQGPGDITSSGPRAYLHHVLLLDFDYKAVVLLHKAHVLGRVSVSILTDVRNEILGFVVGHVESDARALISEKDEYKRLIFKTVPIEFITKAPLVYRSFGRNLFSLNATQLTDAKAGGWVELSVLGGVYKTRFELFLDANGVWRLRDENGQAATESDVFTIRAFNSSYDDVERSKPFTTILKPEEVWPSGSAPWGRVEAASLAYWQVVLADASQLIAKIGLGRFLIREEWR
jgi:hypothetical protein